MQTAKVFWSGRSQAVRLPREFRFDGTEVRISRRGASVVLDPVAETWDWLDDVVGPLDDDFKAATEEDVAGQDRPSLDELA